MRRTVTIGLLLLLVVGLPAAAVVTLLEPAPRVAEETVPSPEAVGEVRRLVQSLRGHASGTPNGAVFEIAVERAQIESMLTLGARFVPGLRGSVEMADGAMTVHLSARLPRAVWRPWVNVTVAVPAYRGAPRLDRVRIGGLDLPPRLTLDVAAVLVDWGLGGQTGSRILRTVQALEIGPDRAVATLAMGEDEGRSLMRRVSSLLRGEEMPTAADIEVYYLALREGMEAGRLPEDAFLPYLAHTVALARDRARPGREGYEITAALFALTRVCGAKEFGLIVGKLARDPVGADGRSWTRRCDGARLNGRIDSRRHFVTAAALQAASTRSVSFAIGEFKELYDTITRAGGFDFTDIAANASGIRFAETLLAAPSEDWPALAARLGTDGDVIAPFDGLPGLMPKADFEAAYGDVESPAYAAMVERIEDRVAALPFHRPLRDAPR